MNRGLLSLLAGGALLASGSLHAATFTLVGATDANNMASVIFNYTPTSSTMGTVSISITNTSTPNGQGGVNPAPHLSGIAFNVPTAVTGFNNGLSTAPTGFFNRFNLNNISTPQAYGNFDFCSETNSGSPNNCNGGGGGVANRISVGETGNFSLVFTGASGLNTLTTADFLSSLSVGRNITPVYFVARFQTTGTDGNGSDVAIPTGPPNFGDPIPEPSTMTLLGAGLVGLAAWARRRRA